MPLYQMFCIASHFREYVSHILRSAAEHASHGDGQKHIKDLVTMSATHVMNEGGVVRNIQFNGTQTLPQRMRRHKQYYTVGE